MDTLPTDLINLVSNYSRSSELVLLLLPTNNWSDLHEDYYRDPTSGALKVLNDSRLVEYFLTAKNIRYANVWTASLLKGCYDNIPLIVKYLDSVKYGFIRMDADPKYYMTPEPQSECYTILYDTTDYNELLKCDHNYHKIYSTTDYNTFEDQIMAALASAIENDDLLFVDYLLTKYKQQISDYEYDWLKDRITVSIFSSADRLNRYKHILKEYINPITISIVDNIMDLNIYIPKQQLIAMVEDFHILTWNDLIKSFINSQIYPEYNFSDPHREENRFEDLVRLQYFEVATNMMRRNCENIKIYIQFDG